MTFEWNNKTTQYEQTIAMMTKENNDFKLKLQEFGDMNRKLFDSENRIAQLTAELEKLQRAYNEADSRSRQLHSQVENKDRDLSVKVTSWEQQVTVYTRENDDLKRRLAEAENRIALLTQEM